MILGFIFAGALVIIGLSISNEIRGLAHTIENAVREIKKGLSK